MTGSAARSLTGPPRDFTRWRQLSRWALALAIAGSALALGSVHTAVLCLVAVVLVGVLGLQLWGCRPTMVSRAATALVATWLALLAWTFVQQIPVPSGLLAAVAPSNADVWSRALLPLREPGPPSAPVSLDPTATRIHLLRGLVYGMAFLCALRVAARTSGLKFLERSVLVSAVVVGIAAALHPALGLVRVYGIVKPESADFGNRIGPLLNENHLAAYLNLGACIALGMALARHSRIPRWVPLAAYGILVALQMWNASRGGVATLVVGSLLVLWLARRREGDRKLVSWQWLVAGAGLLVVLAVGVLATRGRSYDDLTSSDTVKLALIRRAASVLPTFPWVGMGRGAFESVFQAFRSDGEGHIVFTHPENLVLQWTTEWGLPVGLVALLAISLALGTVVVRARDVVPIGPAAGVIAVALHNLVDFSAEVPGVAIALAVCTGCVVGAASKSAGGAAPAWWTRSPRVVVSVTAVATLALVVVTFGARDHELRADQATLRKLALDPAASRDTFVAAARAAMLRHPAEPYLPLMGAVRAARAGDESPIPWIGRTLERASVYGRAHLLLARQLSRRSPAQARLEYRLAMEQDYTLITTAIAEGALLVRGPDDALQLVPVGRFEESVMTTLASALRDRVPAASDRLAEELAARHPSSPYVVRLAAEKSLAMLRRGDGACATDRPGCVRAALENAARLVSAEPQECTSHRLAAEIRIATGSVDDAIASLEGALGNVRDPGACLQFLVAHAEASGDEKRLERALEHLLGLGCATDEQCAASHLQAAAVEERRGHLTAALKTLKRGDARMPGRRDLLTALARVASSAGRHADALDAYRSLVDEDPANPEWRAGVEREKAALERDQHRLFGIE